MNRTACFWESNFGLYFITKSSKRFKTKAGESWPGGVRQRSASGEISDNFCSYSSNGQKTLSRRSFSIEPETKVFFLPLCGSIGAFRNAPASLPVSPYFPRDRGSLIPVPFFRCPVVVVQGTLRMPPPHAMVPETNQISLMSVANKELTATPPRRDRLSGKLSDCIETLIETDFPRSPN